MRSLACVSLLLLAGCGDGIALYEINGTVTLDGKPMEGLMVAFSPEGGGISGAGRTDASGNYTITCPKGKGLPAGMYNVGISEIVVADNGASEMQEVESSSNSSSYEQMAMGNNMAQYKAAEKKKATIPAKYNKQSTLKETVAETDNTINFDLSSK